MSQKQYKAIQKSHNKPKRDLKPGKRRKNEPKQAKKTLNKS